MKRTLRLFVTIFLLCAVEGITSDCPEFEGRWIYGSGWTVAVSGDYAYLGLFEGGLDVFDVSSPWNPTVVGQIDTRDSIYGATVSGDYLYAAMKYKGLGVFDISIPERPREVGNVDTPGYGRDVVVLGDYAYLVNWIGLSVIDVSSPSEPVVVGSVECAGASGVAVSGRYAYVAADHQGLRIFDVLSPSQPIEIGVISAPFRTNLMDVAVSGDYAYLTSRVNDKLWVVFVGSPWAPSEVAILNVGDGSQIEISDGYAYIARENRGLSILDLTEPDNPVEVSWFDTGRLNGVAVSEGRAYLAVAPTHLPLDRTSGLRLVDIADPSDPHELGFGGSRGIARDVAVSRNRAFVADGINGLKVFDVTTPSHIMNAGSAFTEVSPWAVAISGDFAFVAEGGPWGGVLEVFDVSDTSNPISVATLDTDAGANAIAISGDHLYLMAHSLKVIDISTPWSPVELGSIPLGKATDVAIDGDFAFVTVDRMGLRIIDVSVPSMPVEVGVFHGVYGVEVSGDYGFVGDVFSMRVLDVSDPSAPFEVAVVDLRASLRGLVISGGFAYLAGHHGELWVIDISDPTAPFEVGQTDTVRSDISSVTAANGYVFVTDFEDGLEIFDPSQCVEPVPPPRRSGRRVEP